MVSGLSDRLTAALIIKVCEMAYSIRDFRENPNFSRKSEIFAKIRIFVKLSDFDENLDGFQIHFTPKLFVPLIRRAAVRSFKPSTIEQVRLPRFTLLEREPYD